MALSVTPSIAFLLAEIKEQCQSGTLNDAYFLIIFLFILFLKNENPKTKPKNLLTFSILLIENIACDT